MAQDRAVAEMPSRPGWAGLRALQAGRSCGFAEARYEMLVRPGPRLAEAAGLIADCLVGLDGKKP
jgi:iron complex transport system substrate-binding protein